MCTYNIGYDEWGAQDMDRRVQAVIAVLILTLLVSAIGFLVLERSGVDKVGLLVVLLTPGFDDEVRALLAEGDELYVIGYGADPHEIQLSPSEVEVIRKADLIISMGHTSIDIRIEELKKRGEVKARILNLLEIPELVLPKLPQDQHNEEHHDHPEELVGRNVHEPFYDPRNLIVILNKITSVLVELRPEKRNVYEANYERLKARLEEMIRNFEGILGGRKAIISTAEIQPAIAWLGVEIVAYLVFDQHESPSPRALERAIKEMEGGEVIIFVAVRCDGVCSLSSYADKWLEEEAKERNATIIKVPLGYTGSSVMSKLEYVLSQVQRIRGG